MKAKQTRLKKDFLSYCAKEDKPIQSFDQIKRELYFRSLGLSKKPVPEQDEELALIDLSLFSRGIARKLSSL